MEYLWLMGRLLVGGYFIFAGVHHVVHLRELSESASDRGVFLAPFFVLASGVLLFSGGAGVFFWAYPGVSGLMLASFLIASSFVMHPFWLLKNASPEVRDVELRFFFGNLALAGALILVATRVLS